MESKTGPDEAPDLKSRLKVMFEITAAGGVAGCCAKTAVAPLDRIKILMQAHNKHYKELGVFSTLLRVQKKEGFLGLYQGNGVQMLRIFPYSAIQFLSFEQYKKVIRRYTHHKHMNVENLAAGGLAGMTAVLITYPLDLVRARLAYQVKGEHIYMGIMHTFKSMHLNEGGFFALFRGIVPTLLGMAPYAGLAFFTFEWLKKTCLKVFPDQLGRTCPKNTGGLVLIVPAKVLCGGFAGAVAQTVVYPLDVTRRKIQLAQMLPDPTKYTGSWMKIMATVYNEHGVQNGLYRGLSVNYIRVMPSVAISFTCYESLRQWFGLDTGAGR